MTPFRLKVMQNLTDVFASITPANGYETDLSDYVDDAGRPARRVFRGRDRFSSNDPIPLLSILEDARPTEANASGSGKGSQWRGQWKLLIQGFIQNDNLNPTDAAYTLSADVLKALAKIKSQPNDILSLGPTVPCVTGLSFEQPVVRPADGEISTVAFFYLSVTLTMVEDMENPFVA